MAMGNAEHGPFELAVRESAAEGVCAAVAVPAERSVCRPCVQAATGFWRDRHERGDLGRWVVGVCGVVSRVRCSITGRLYIHIYTGRRPLARAAPPSLPAPPWATQPQAAAAPLLSEMATFGPP